jgi:hypothetical protein
MRFQLDTAFYPVPRLISWDWTSPCEIYISLFTHCQYLLNFSSHYIVVSITMCCREWLDIKYTWMPSPVFIKLWSIWLCVFPSGDVQVNLWILWWRNIVLLTVRFLDVAKITTLTPLSLLIPCKSYSQLFVWKCLSSLLWHWYLPTKYSYII